MWAGEHRLSCSWRPACRRLVAALQAGHACPRRPGRVWGQGARPRLRSEEEEPRVGQAHAGEHGMWASGGPGSGPLSIRLVAATTEV